MILRYGGYGGQQGQRFLWLYAYHFPQTSCYITTAENSRFCHHQWIAYKLGLSTWSQNKKTFFLLQKRAEFHLLLLREKEFWYSNTLLHLLWKQSLLWIWAGAAVAVHCFLPKFLSQPHEGTRQEVRQLLADATVNRKMSTLTRNKSRKYYTLLVPSLDPNPSDLLPCAARLVVLLSSLIYKFTRIATYNNCCNLYSL